MTDRATTDKSTVLGNLPSSRSKRTSSRRKANAVRKQAATPATSTPKRPKKRVSTATKKAAKPQNSEQSSKASASSSSQSGIGSLIGDLQGTVTKLGNACIGAAKRILASLPKP